VRGRAATRARVAGVSLQQWQRNTSKQVKQSIIKIIGNRPIDELNGFQKRRLTNYQRRLVSRTPTTGGQIDLGTYYPTEEGSPVRYRPLNTGKVYSNNPAQVLILKVLPMSSQGGTAGEKIVLVNKGQFAVDLNGWSLVDAAANKFDLNSIIPASWPRSVELDISKDNLRMNNDGDIIDLVDDKGIIRDIFSYSEAEVGVDRWIVRSKNRLKSLK
jgi:hypothetical protein